MWQQIMSVALGNGLWAALFCLLFLYQLKDSRAREKKYVVIIEGLGERLKTVEEIREGCERISETLNALSRRDL